MKLVTAPAGVVDGGEVRGGIQRLLGDAGDANGSHQ
jgi:hypothetical protein